MSDDDIIGHHPEDEHSTAAQIKRGEHELSFDRLVESRATLKADVQRWFEREKIRSVDDLLEALDRAAAADEAQMQADLDTLVEAAREAVDAMLWILGGFDRVVTEEERNAALPRYHMTRDRLMAALKPYSVAQSSDSQQEAE